MNVEWKVAETRENGLVAVGASMDAASLAWYKVVGIELGLLVTILAPLVCGVLLAR